MFHKEPKKTNYSLYKPIVMPEKTDHHKIKPKEIFMGIETKKKSSSKKKPKWLYLRFIFYDYKILWWNIGNVNIMMTQKKMKDS